MQKNCNVNIQLWTNDMTWINYTIIYCAQLKNLKKGKWYTRLVCGCKWLSKIIYINHTSENISTPKALTLTCAWTTIYTKIIFTILEQAQMYIPKTHDVMWVNQIQWIGKLLYINICATCKQKYSNNCVIIPDNWSHIFNNVAYLMQQ